MRAFLCPAQASDWIKGDPSSVRSSGGHYNHRQSFHRTAACVVRLNTCMKSTNSEKTDSIPTANLPAESLEKILVNGIHLEITPALHAAAVKKAARLLRHQINLIRVRISLEHVQSDRTPFIAKGHIEISGPDLVASVASDDGYKSIDLLVDRLDRMLRERTRASANRRNNRPEGTEFRDCLAQAN